MKTVLERHIDTWASTQRNSTTNWAIMWGRHKGGHSMRQLINIGNCRASIANKFVTQWTSNWTRQVEFIVLSAENWQTLLQVLSPSSLLLVFLLSLIFVFLSGFSGNSSGVFISFFSSRTFCCFLHPRWLPSSLPYPYCMCVLLHFHEPLYHNPKSHNSTKMSVQSMQTLVHTLDTRSLDWFSFHWSSML